MKFTKRKLNLFLLLKLPSAYFTGVRVKKVSDTGSLVTVKHRWVNQNPFKSMFWAVQGMAAELATGILVIKAIKDSNKRISMLVVDMNASFSKKATGNIKFECFDGALIRDEIAKAIETKQGRTFEIKVNGINEDGVQVSQFKFNWSVKVKQ